MIKTIRVRRRRPAASRRVVRNPRKRKAPRTAKQKAATRKLIAANKRRAAANRRKASNKRRKSKSASKRRKPAGRRVTPKRNRRKKTMAKRKTVRRKKRTTKRRKATKKRKSTKRSAAAKKAAKTRARKKAARSRAAKKAARTRKRRASSKKRKTVKRRRKSVSRKRKSTKRKSPKRVAAGKKAARTRKRKAAKRKKSRKSTRRKGRVSLSVRVNPRRRRRSVRRRRSLARRNPGFRPIRRRKRRRNPSRKGSGPKKLIAGVKRLLPQAGFALLGIGATNVLPGLIVSYVPGAASVAGMAGRFAPVVLSGASLAAVWFASEKVKPLKKRAFALKLGATIGFVKSVLEAFVPANLLATVGLAPSGMAGYWSEGTATIADYVPAGAMEGYVSEGSPTLGAYVHQPMGLDVEQAVAGVAGYVEEAVAGLGLDVFPSVQAGCKNCHGGSVPHPSSLPLGLLPATRAAALGRAGHSTQAIIPAPPSSVLGAKQCGIFTGGHTLM